MTNFQMLKSKRAKMIAKKPSPGKHVNTVRNFGEGLFAGRRSPSTALIPGSFFSHRDSGRRKEE